MPAHSIRVSAPPCQGAWLTWGYTQFAAYWSCAYNTARAHVARMVAAGSLVRAAYCPRCRCVLCAPMTTPTEHRASIEATRCTHCGRNLGAGPSYAYAAPHTPLPTWIPEQAAKLAGVSECVNPQYNHAYNNRPRVNAIRRPLSASLDLTAPGAWVRAAEAWGWHRSQIADVLEDDALRELAQAWAHVVRYQDRIPESRKGAYLWTVVHGGRMPPAEWQPRHRWQAPAPAQDRRRYVRDLVAAGYYDELAAEAAQGELEDDHEAGEHCQSDAGGAEGKQDSRPDLAHSLAAQSLHEGTQTPVGVDEQDGEQAVDEPTGQAAPYRLPQRVGGEKRAPGNVEGAQPTDEHRPPQGRARLTRCGRFRLGQPGLTVATGGGSRVHAATAGGAVTQAGQFHGSPPGSEAQRGKETTHAPPPGYYWPINLS